MYSGQNELWIISGKYDSINVAMVHTIVNNMDDIDDILHAAHALTSSETTNKICTKTAAFQAVVKCGYELLHSFGKSKISDKMILLTEKLLVELILKSSESNNFDDIQLRKITTVIVIHPNSHKTSILTVLPLVTCTVFLIY